MGICRERFLMNSIIMIPIKYMTCSNNSTPDDIYIVCGIFLGFLCLLFSLFMVAYFWPENHDPLEGDD